MADYDVIIIGAGLGGITCGALLAKQGRRTLVLEQSDRIGGCCSTFERDGYSFDTGASIIEIIQPIEKAFQELGTTLQEEVDLIPCDPIMSVIFEDGSRVTYPLSAAKTGEMITSIDAEDGRRWPDFVAYCSELAEVCLNTIFAMPANSAGDMVKMVQCDPRLVRFLPVFADSYQNVIERFFKNDKVKRTMTYQSLYFGLPPALVPGAYAMVPYTEHMGVFYARGGMIQIPEAFRRVGSKFGLEVRTKTLVTRVMIENARAAGVRLADGTEITANAIVSNVNAKMLYQEMVGEEYLPPLARRGISSYKYSLSTPMIYLGLNYEPPLEAHHSLIAISPEELNSYWFNNLQKGRLPEKHFGLVCWPTHSDPSLAPKGRHILNIIPEGFYRLEGESWDDIKEEFIDRTIRFLDRAAVPGLADHVDHIDIATPLDYERRLLLPQGAIYSLQQDLPSLAVFRPAAKSKAISGLYLTGSSTHPGGGVPTCVASGSITASLINQFEH